jgi:uncharacterized protein with HEPN domain
LKSHKAYLDHIIEESDYLVRQSGSLDYDSFIDDENLTRSFVRSLEIIGEAVKNLPEEFKKLHSDIEWKKIAGMRDMLMHHYFGVSYKIVWDVVKNQVPDLKNKIESYMK